MNRQLRSQLKALAEQVSDAVPHTTTEMTTYPSGAWDMDIRLDGRLLYIRYHTSGHFGVDEVLDGDPGFESGDRFIFETFEPAAEKLMKLVTGVESVHPSARRAV